MVAKNKNKRISKNRQINSKIIDLLEIKEDYHLLPHKVKELIIEASWPKISVDFSKSKDHPGISAIENKIKEKLLCSVMKINEKDLSLNESGNILAIDSIISSLNNYVSKESFLEKNKRAKAIVLATSIKNFHKNVSKKVYDAANLVWNRSGLLFSDIVWGVIRDHYRFDCESLYFSFVDFKNTGYKKFHSIEVRPFYPKNRVFKIDGKPRDSFLCYHLNPYELSELTLSVNKNQPLKVYIQDHAIKRIMERLKLNHYGDMFFCLSNSLFKCKSPIKSSDCYLFDYYYGKYKLGYLVVSLEEDAALIRTFKFITMSGTPEYFRLKKQLGGVREDFEYLGLDSLDLLNSDVFSDPKLREIFKNSGLDHLFDIKDHVTFETPQNFLAEDIKKYFRIKV